MRYQYYLCDVFTDTRFSGNQLAVLPDAQGLTDVQMQQIAREFNFSESTFVLPPEQGQTRKVRIFTPTTELAFAGHPNIGTAFVLATIGELGTLEHLTSITFEEQAGLVPITIERRPQTLIWCELSAPTRFSLGQTVSAPILESALSLTPSDIITTTHPPQMASVGLPFLIVELRDRTVLERARPAMDGFAALVAAGITPDVFVYTQSADDFDIRARMFAPLDGIAEDPATGSASCALAGLLSYYNEALTGKFHWRIAQGVEMGRPSVLEVRSVKREGIVSGTWVGGTSVLIGKGFIEVD